jgi:hypothetical protein
MPNRLAAETSPYLLQHADNPVDWYPWGEEALSRARDENKPILLSVGYSACHWCHVMAHESFEDPATAGLMNELFVNVKVDREERPDIDQIYQAAHAMLSRRGGGWPLTMFLTPEQVPFYGGTYFPPTARHGLPAFAELLRGVAQAWRDQGPAIAEQNERLREALASINPERADGGGLDAAPISRALASLEESFDPVDGGWGRAPKFPHPTEIEFCLRRHAQDGVPHALTMAALTLTRMAEGGIFDHVGGGFCRYSVDGEWTIPHFEKMLYDNAQLLPLYADARRVTGDALFADTARAVARWVIDAMQAPEGGFHSSYDADSEGEEGRFYLWTPEAVRALLHPDEYAVVAPHLGLDRDPNFEGHAWNLRVSAPLPAVAERLGIAPEMARARLDAARAKLLRERSRRVPPGRDDKVLASWNALMAGGLMRAARAMDEPAWAAAARRALDFLRDRMWKDGRLSATYKDGRARFNAYLDDHAFLLAALLESMQTGYRDADRAWAVEVAEALLSRFEDPADGGFFFTAHDHEVLIHRSKAGHDNATPSGNGVAARSLIELAHLVGEPRYLAAAERALGLFASQFARHPGGFASLLVALDLHLAPPTTVILRGDPALTSEWARTLERGYAPRRIVIDAGDSGAVLGPALPAAPAGAAAAAWVCLGTQCLAPVTDLAGLQAALRGG